MMRLSKTQTRWLWVVAFAVGMAWVEAATVYYLRVLVDRVNPYQANPLPIRGVLGQVEIVREAATLVMLLAVGMLAGKTWHKRLGYAAIAFGAWDIFYYVFLWLICDWPASLLDWDVLFLIPLPWWGPVLAPASIALLLIVWGTLAIEWDDRRQLVTPMLWRMNWLGMAIALYTFMADSLRAVHQGIDVTKMPLPDAFDWPMFSLALLLMAAPIAQLAWRRRFGRWAIPASDQSASSSLT